MKIAGFIVMLITVFGAFGQSAFDRSEQAFHRYLSADSTRARKELAFQRTHARSKQQRIRYLLHEAAYHYQSSNLDRAGWFLDRAAKQPLLKKDVALEGEYVRLRSLIAYRNNAYDQSSALIRAFLHKHQHVPTDVSVGLSLNLCENDMALGNYAKARQRALKGYTIFKKTPDALPEKLKVRLLSSLYNAFYYEAKYDSALYYLYQAEPFLKEGSVEKAGFYSRLAIVHTIMHDHGRAIGYYKKGIAILEKGNEPIQLAHAWYNLGVSYKEVNEDKAIACMETALNLARKAQSKQIIGYALQDLGDLYLSRKQYEKAARYNQEALTVLREAGNDRGVANVLLNLGRQGYETGHFDEALVFLNEALQMTENSEDIASLEYCYEYLYKTYERMGDYRMAHRYHRLFAKAQQQLLRLDLQSNIDKLNLEYDIQVKEARNKLLKEEVELKNKKIAAERTAKWLLAGLLVVLLAGGLFLRRLLLQRTRLRELELQLVQTAVQTLEREKAHTVAELDQVKQQLISKNSMIGELNKLLQENEQSLISRDQLGTLVTNDADWVQFLAKLQVLFPHFADHLKGKHPGLSNNEFRLAALIRLNLSDKEISELLFIELSSVKKAKHRLKQKLGLETGEKLDVYLGQF